MTCSRSFLSTVSLAMALTLLPSAGWAGAGSDSAEAMKDKAKAAVKAKVEGEVKAQMGGEASASGEDTAAAWEKAGAPGDMHEHLAGLVGEWKADCKYWFDAGQPPHESVSECTRSMIFGGRFLKQEFTGTFMGKPFEGLGITGYNNTRSQFENVWLDSNGTVINVSKGAMSDDKVVTMTSSYKDPVSGQIIRNREVTTYPDADTEVFEMFETKDGKEMKTIEIRYTRKK